MAWKIPDGDASNQTIESQTDIRVEVDGAIVTVPAGTTVDMALLFLGIGDYAIWVRKDGLLAVAPRDETPV